MPNNNNMSNNNSMPKMGHYIHGQLVMTIQDCEATCEHMTNHLKMIQEPDRIKQAILLRECADICGLTAKFIARGAMFDQYIALLCSDICKACGEECALFSDKMSQDCAKICLHCARECEMFANMDMSRNGDMDMDRNMNMDKNMNMKR